MNRLALVVALVLCALVITGGSYLLGQARQGIDENHQLICLLDRLFGLDRPLPAAQLKKLRQGQIVALATIIESCPELKKGGNP